MTRLLDPKAAMRLAAGVVVLLAIVVAAPPALRHHEHPPEPENTSVSTDPLAMQLRRCQQLGEAGAHDPTCLRGWAENRRRFLGPAGSR